MLHLPLKLWLASVPKDMKSANVMVSSDGGVFITDFGFATAGKFGPPPPLIEKTVSGPAAGPGAAGASATTTTDTGPKLTGSDVAEAHACGAAAPPADSRCPTVDTNGGSGKGAKTSSERVPDSDVNGSTTTPTKSKHRVTEKAASGSVAPREEARGAATSNPEDQDNAGEGGGFGGTERPPNRHSVLYGTLKGYTPRYQSPEVSAIIDEKSKAAAVAAAVAAAGATAAGVAQAGGQPSPNQAPQVGSLHCMFWRPSIFIYETITTRPIPQPEQIRRCNLVSLIVEPVCRSCYKVHFFEYNFS